MSLRGIPDGFMALVLAEADHILRLVGPLPEPKPDDRRAHRCVADAAHALLSWLSAKGIPPDEALACTCKAVANDLPPLDTHADEGGGD